MSTRSAPKMGVKKRAPKKAKAPAEQAPLPEDTPRVLHCHSTFAPGGKELRAVQLMNAFGRRLRHSVVSAVPGQYGAHEYIAKGVKVDYPRKFPALAGFPSPGRLAKIAKALKKYDLILTYNWGAMDVVMAHTMFAENMGLPPLIHHEDGFNEDEATELKLRRNVYRRVGLRKSSALVVPSKRLEAIGLNVWGQPPERLIRIPNGIDTKRFAKKPNRSALRVMKREGEYWVGTLAGFRPVKQLDELVTAFSKLPENWQLVLVGDGPQRDNIAMVAEGLNISHRVHMPGAVTDPSEVIGMFDIFALSSASEQFPLSVVEAMAAGLPVAAPDVGDIRDMIAQENHDFIAPADDTAALAKALEQLAKDESLRASAGAANKAKAREQFDEAAMVEAYRRLYADALAREF